MKIQMNFTIIKQIRTYWLLKINKKIFLYVLLKASQKLLVTIFCMYFTILSYYHVK